MAMDDFELISHNEARNLREQLSKLKGGGSNMSSELKHSINELNEKLGSLIDIFDAAVEDLREEDKESEIIASKINPIMEKINEIDEQNKKLAQGMVAINSLVDEKLSQIARVAESLQHSQTTIMDSLQSTKSAPPSYSRSMPSFDDDSSLDGGLPPLPGSEEKEKKKFKLF
jgi:uncharacterized phage infection (PIP) family protein YhgE